MLNSYSKKSFQDEIKDSEAHLKSIEKKFGKDSRRWRERNRALNDQKKSYASISKPEVCCG